ncbi:carotenoid 9 [Quercus suber]|uniref:carotenoid 9,10-dioxygenase n=1 Tax=Quercus suber TaxID=58331 RepID=A0AAW0LHP7_QUESU
MWFRCVPDTLTGKPAVDKSASSGDIVGDVLISLTGINLLHLIMPLWPMTLNVKYVSQVGPNPKFTPVAGYNWFDGDGCNLVLRVKHNRGVIMVHGLRIKDGKATDVSLYVRTSKLQQKEYFGAANFLRFLLFFSSLLLGDLTGLFGLIMMIMRMLRVKLKVLDISYGTGTELRLFSLQYLDVLKVLEDGDLQTLGMLDYDKRLAHSFPAHPKVDPFTESSHSGEMFTFGSSNSPPYITYRVTSKDGFMHDPVPITILS